MNVVNVNDRKVGPGQPCFIVAEAGVNHNADVELAKQLVDPVPPIGRPDVPGGVARIIERALAKDPRERFRTAAEFRVALAAGRPSAVASQFAR